MRRPERAAEAAESARPPPGLRPPTDRRARRPESSTRPTGPKPGRRHFPVLRVGRRLVIRPTWRRHRRRPDDVVLALDPGMAFGTGLHPTTRLCLAASEVAGRPRRPRRGARPRRRLRFRDPRHRRAQARRARGPRRRYRPDRDRGDDCQCARATGSPAAFVRSEGSLPTGERPVRRRPREPDRVGPRDARSRCFATSSGRAACSSPPGSSSTARRRSGPRSRLAGLDVVGRIRRWRLGRAGGRQALIALRPRERLPAYNRPDARVLPVPPRHPHRPGGQPVSAVDPAAVRAADPSGRRGEPEPVRQVPPVDAGPWHGDHRTRAGNNRDRTRRNPRRVRCSGSPGCSSP